MTGTGLDHLGVKRGTGLDQVKVNTATTGLALGPVLDLNFDGRVDVGMNPAGFVTVDGGGGSDLLDGTGSDTFQLVLEGGLDGNDTLRGGGRTDILDGWNGDDKIVSNGDVFLAIDARPGSLTPGQRLLARANGAIARADVSISLEAFPVEPDRLAEAIAACAHDAARRRQIGIEPSLAWLAEPAAPAPAGKPGSTPFAHHAAIG